MQANQIPKQFKGFSGMIKDDFNYFLTKNKNML